MAPLKNPFTKTALFHVRFNDCERLAPMLYADPITQS